MELREAGLGFKPRVLTQVSPSRRILPPIKESEGYTGGGCSWRTDGAWAWPAGEQGEELEGPWLPRCAGEQVLCL